jgi:putative PIN family toxin of toxin-antitoxin system
MRGKRAVFDVNVFVSYIIKDRMSEIFDMVFDSNIQLYSNDEMRDELKEVLGRPKFVKYLSAPLEYYIDFFDKVTVAHHTTPVFEECADPKDNYLFDLAYQTESEYLVSGDKKVLATPVKKTLQLLTLTAFKKMVLDV